MNLSQFYHWLFIRAIRPCRSERRKIERLIEEINIKLKNEKL